MRHRTIDPPLTDMERARQELAICADARLNHSTVTQRSAQYGEDETYIERVLEKAGIPIPHRAVSAPPSLSNGATSGTKAVPPIAPPSPPSVAVHERAPSTTSAERASTTSTVAAPTSPALLALSAARTILTTIKGMQAGPKGHFMGALEHCIEPMRGRDPVELHEVLRLVRTASGFVDD